MYACLGMRFSSARGPAVRACQPTYGTDGPRLETAGSHAGHVEAQAAVAHSQSMTDHGGSHTQARSRSTPQEQANDHHNSDFPAPLAAKSPPQQHDMSSLKLASITKTTFPTNKPKSHPFNNTCVLSPSFHPSQIALLNSNALMSQLDVQGITCDIVENSPTQH